MIEAPVFDFPYDYLPKNLRVLWHQSLNTILEYPYLPRRTINFDFYPVFMPKFNNQVTLSSTVSTRHEGYIQDAEISEVWLADDISMNTAFFYYLKRIYSAIINTGEYLVWYPKDKTDKAFCIQPLKLYAGDENNQAVHAYHGEGKDYGWLREEVRFTFKVLMVLDTPDAVAFVEGT